MNMIFNELIENVEQIKLKNQQEYFDRQLVRKQLSIMPTYHYVQNQGKLMMPSRENGLKPQFGQFFDDFEVKYLQFFFLKIGFIQIEGHV